MPALLPLRIVGLSLGLLCLSAHAGDALTLVVPFVGNTSHSGSTYPGAALPHSLVKLSPDTLRPSTAGYNPTEPILGFSHTHIGGTAGKAFGGQLRVRPQTGPLDVAPPASPKARETASPGYYAVELTHDRVHAELTLAERAGVHRYTFPAASAETPAPTARVLLDLASLINNFSAKNPAGTCLGAAARRRSDRAAEGSTRIVAGFGKLTYTVYFVAEFDQPALATGTWLDATATPSSPTVTSTENQPAGLYAEFAPGSTVGLRVGISYTSIAQAGQNLAPIAGLSFDAVRARAEATWREHLATIAVSGGTETQRRQFYTALYHSVLAPTDVTGDNAHWAADDQPVYWDIYTLWDTFRTTNPLRILIQPETERRIIRSLLAVYQKTGWLPDDWVYSKSGIPFQGGTHADNVIADAVVKNLGGFDLALAYEAVRKNATIPHPSNSPVYPHSGRLAPYFTLGYVPAVLHPGSADKTRANPFSAAVSRTLEYATNDYSAAQIATALGHTQDATRFTARSQRIFDTLFHPGKKLFWGKTEDGEWIPEHDAAAIVMGWDAVLYEGSAWQYRFSVPHDVQGLITRVGGPSAFLALLDEYFERGLHWQGNEPCFLTPWLHAYAGRPDKTTDRVHAILAKDFNLTTKGYPGDEDVGAMSAWYVLSAIGLYPNAGQDIYLLATPLFEKITLRLGATGAALVISAPGLSPKNKYIQSATLNGRPWNQAWLRHADIINGAELTYQLGPSPSAWGTKLPPPSLTPTP